MSYYTFDEWGKMTEKLKTQKVVFGININKELKLKLKKYCVENDKTLTEAIEEAIVEYLQKRGVRWKQ